jgi:hypothetical protein
MGAALAVDLLVELGQVGERARVHPVGGWVRRSAGLPGTAGVGEGSPYGAAVESAGCASAGAFGA